MVCAGEWKDRGRQYPDGPLEDEDVRNSTWDSIRGIGEGIPEVEKRRKDGVIVTKVKSAKVTKIGNLKLSSNFKFK
jgi:hypothetical protein